MTLTDLRYFVTLARLRHFGRSAEACHVSQPTLSVALRKLESEWGVRLFERRRQELLLSAAGERLLAAAERVLTAADELQSLVRENDELALPLRLGCIFTIAPFLLPSLVASLRTRTPGLTLMIEENYTAVLLERLQQGELDAIIIADAQERPGLRTHSLYREDFYALLPGQHSAAAHSSLSAADLDAEEILLLGEGHCLRDQVLIACPAWKDADAQRHLPSGSSLQTLRHMVALGMGVTLAPATALPSLLAQDDALVARPLHPTSGRVVSLVHRQPPSRPRALHSLLAQLRALQLAGTHAP